MVEEIKNIFSKKIKLEPHQYNLIRGLAKDTNRDQNDVVWDLIELGMTTLVLSRKSTEDKEDALEVVVKKLRDTIENDDDLLRFSQLLEKWFDASKNIAPK